MEVDAVDQLADGGNPVVGFGSERIEAPAGGGEKLLRLCGAIGLDQLMERSLITKEALEPIDHQSFQIMRGNPPGSVPAPRLFMRPKKHRRASCSERV